MKKRIIIVVDTYDWAFHSIAKQIERTYHDRYDFHIVARAGEAKNMQADVALFFWWKSAIHGRTLINADRLCVGMYDQWSVAGTPDEFAKLVPHVDCFFGGNDAIVANLRLLAPRKQVELTEDGVDLDLFTQQPFPEEFTIGWTGNRMYKNMGLGDFKGVDMIEEVAHRCNMPLMIQDKQVKQIPQSDMPEQFYRKISCYVCASEREGTPNPVLEALACGRSVVSTSVGTVPKVLRDGVNGFIVNRSSKGIAEGIFRAKQLGDRGKKVRESVAAWDWTKKAMAFGSVLEG